MIHGYADGSYQPDRPASEAELLKLILSVNYTGEAALIYLLGNQMIPSRLAPSLEEFEPEAAVTRAEVLEWLRMLSLQGVMQLNFRLVEPSDINELPAIPAGPRTDPDYFSFTSLTKDDLSIYDSSGKALISFGMPKESIEREYGISEEKDLSSSYIYPDFNVGFDTMNNLNYWKISDDLLMDEGSAELRTSKGIATTYSTFFDVLEAYGTGGYYGNNIIAYYYEEDAEGALHAVTDPALMRYNSEGYVLSFIIDEETKQVWYMSLSTYQRRIY